MAKKNSFKIKSGQFIKGTSFYQRGGTLHDRWNNTYKIPTSYRSNKNGLVVNIQGKVLGKEQNRTHTYGNDYRPIKKLTISQTAQKKKIMMILRKKGKVR